eukprot:PLAT6515.1.p1 GENE.PLAT6515.1~~PLAT6515.1.p1  ORF type:complete len:484 (-),score=159.79 PLAT6515.1:114-1499(-)
MATLHRVSETLRERHPYFPSKHAAHFAGEPDASQVTRAYGRREMPKLVALLVNEELPEADLPDVMTLLLQGLTRAEAREEAIALGAVAACTALLACTLPIVRERAAAALQACARSREGRAAMREASSIVILATLLADGEADVRLATACALAELADARDGRTMIVSRARVVESLEAALLDSLGGEPDAAVITANMTTFARLTTDYSAIELVLRTDIITKIVHLLRDGGDGSDEQELAALRTLANLGSHPDGKSGAIAAGAVSDAALRLAHGNEGIRRAASSSLMALAVDEAGKVDVMRFAVEGLATALTDDSSAVAHNAKLAILLASDYPPAKEKFVEALLHETDLMQHVFAADALPQLHAWLLSDVHIDDVTAAAVAVARLTEDDDGVDAAMQVLSLIPALAARLTCADDSPRLFAAVETALAQLCAASERAAMQLNRAVTLDSRLKAAMEDSRALAKFAE